MGDVILDGARFASFHLSPQRRSLLDPRRLVSAFAAQWRGTRRRSPCRAPQLPFSTCACARRRHAMRNFDHALLCFFRHAPPKSSVKLFLFLFVSKLGSSSGNCAQSPTRSRSVLHFSICASLPGPSPPEGKTTLDTGVMATETVSIYLWLRKNRIKNLCSVDPMKLKQVASFKRLQLKGTLHLLSAAPLNLPGTMAAVATSSPPLSCVHGTWLP